MRGIYLSDPKTDILISATKNKFGRRKK